MTFTEAAIEVLRREGKPLHFKKIAEIAIRESLLDHVGKIPEEVMGGQLANHCRLPHLDRKVAVVQAGTFALAEWGLDEDPGGLEGMIEPPPEADLPYRARERHPIPSREMARSSGRGDARGRRREETEERRPRRYPPPAEVAYEILAGTDRALTLAEIAAQGAERSLMPDAFVRDTAALASALAEDNRRREAASRRPLFAIDGDRVGLAAQVEPAERPAPAAAAAPARPATAGELRRAGLAALRRKLRESDGPTVEHVAARLLEAMELRDLKVAKRGRDHVVYTARRRMGLLDVRHCVRVLRGGADAARRDVSDLRRDVANYGAQLGVIVSTGEAAREARGEAAAAGQLPVLLLCGDALAEALAEHGLGARVVAVPEVDEAYFAAAAEAAQAEEAARRARREERERREGREREPREPRDGRDAGPRGEPAERGREAARAGPADEAAPSGRAGSDGAGSAPAAEPEPIALLPAAAPERVVEVQLAGEDADDGDEEGDDEDDGITVVDATAPAAAGAAADAGAQGEGRRRRRRRRRRGGRGRGREGAAGAPASGASAGAPPGPTAGPGDPSAAAAADAGPPAPPAEGGPADAASPPPLPPVEPPPPRPDAPERREAAEREAPAAGSTPPPPGPGGPPPEGER